jgi:flavin reductase (DIM6/NTAB) family NADH-FMN oxidoreductase RutF
MVVAKDTFRQSMSRFATGVTVVTTLDGQGKIHGMTANSFTSVCLDPPLILVCVDFRTNTHSYIESTKAMGVNVLSEKQLDIGRYFARKPIDRIGPEPYKYTLGQSKLPIIEGALAFFGCRVVDTHVHGDHSVYISQVEEVVLGSAEKPLLFFESKFTQLNS